MFLSIILYWFWLFTLTAYTFLHALLHIISVNNSSNELLLECLKNKMQPCISLVCNLDIKFVYICKFLFGSLNTITLGETTILKKWII